MASLARTALSWDVRLAMVQREPVARLTKANTAAANAPLRNTIHCRSNAVSDIVAIIMAIRSPVLNAAT